MPTFDKYYKNDNFRLFYREVLTDVRRPTIVLLHGWSGNNTCFVDLERQLHAWGYNTVTPDLRGHGLSDKHRRRRYYRWPFFVEDLNLILKIIAKKYSDLYIIGYSAGGTIALKHAARYPRLVKKIITISASTFNPLRNWKIRLITPLAQGVLYFGSQIFKFDRRTKYVGLDLLKVQGYWASVYKGLKSMPLDINLWLLLNYAGLKIAPLEAIKIPVWFLRGEHDKFVSRKEALRFCSRLKRAKSINIEDSGHYLVTKHQKQLNFILQDILAK